MIIHPRKHSDIKTWFQDRVRAGDTMAIPEIADYEVRRSLLRINSTRSLGKLNNLKTSLSFIPLSSEAMTKAAECWAQARQKGIPAADDKSLDGDMILVAQTLILLQQGYNAIIATTNVRHLSHFVPAKEWHGIG
jgi:toxin FitB